MEKEYNKNISCELQRQHLCTHITTLKCFNNFLFAAESNQVLLFDWKEKIFLEKEIVFRSCSIHGIRIDDSNKVLFFGAKSIRIFYFNSSSPKRLSEVSAEFYMDDWIHDVQWIIKDKKTQNRFAVISAHNCLSIWDCEKRKTNVFQCAENCILYTGSIICQDADVMVIAAGTVFKKILLWSPNSLKEIHGRKLPFQSLSGHQGVIFSVTYNKPLKLLCSTSDDRSVRLWKIHNSTTSSDFSLDFWEMATIEISHVLFAHESRVWMSAVLKNCILSVGEDSNLCFWNLDGNLLKKKKCHKNGSIWCLETAQLICMDQEDASEQVENYIAFTGGSDGGVYMWNVDSAFSNGIISQISLYSREPSTVMDFPRTTCLLTNTLAEHLMVTTDKGWLSIYDMEHKNWKDVLYDSSFVSYCIPSVSSKSVYLALGNIAGELLLFNLKEPHSEKSKRQKFKIHENKICSLHWVNHTSDYLLTCSTKGDMVLWKIAYKNEEFDMQCIQKLYLPKCKLHWWSTAALYIHSKNSIIVGDRGGSISVYFNLHNSSSQLEDSQANPHIAHRYIHGENGVTDIQERNSLVYSAGRDGKVQLYAMTDSSLNLLHTIKVSHDLEWIGKILFYGEDLLLLGFHTKYFMVWSTLLESSVMTVECGGGHRSWDFCLSNEGHATFVAIKKKDVIFCKEDLQPVLKRSILKAGISGQEFCHATYLFTKSYSSSDSMSIVASAGEDNALRIIGFLNGDEPQVVSICSLSGHLSSIRAIHKVKMTEENAYLLVSVGGRSQMMIWRITDDSSLQCEQLGSYILSCLSKTKKQSKQNRDIQIDPQTRLMDVAVCYPETNNSSSGKYIISTACSDSYFRIYVFDINLKELTLCHNLHHGENCILKLSQIPMKHLLNSILFVTGATDGCIKVFNYEMSPAVPCNIVQTCYTSSQPIVPNLQLKLHQSGINALDVKHVKGTTWLICSAGDDNALSAALVNLTTVSSEKPKLEMISEEHIYNAHSSQITGIKIFDPKVIVTASIDQRVNVWRWNFSNNLLTVKLKISKISLIPDIAHLDAWQNEITEGWTLLVCGQGLESFNLLLNDTTE